MNDFNRLHGLYHSGLAKEELQRRKNCYMVLNRDFLEDLPYQVRDVLDRLKYDYGNRSWFPEAWEKYRKHVLEAGLGGKIKMPGAVFNEYLDKYELKLLEKLYSNVGGESSVPMYHSATPVKLTFDMYVDDYMQHYGVKGQKWGIRRFQNEDGTLTAEGKARYGYDEATGKMSAEGEKKFKKDRTQTIRNEVNLASYAGLAETGKSFTLERMRKEYGNEAVDDFLKDEKRKNLIKAGSLSVAMLLTTVPMVVAAIKSKN